jgi:hypothetical protein
MGEMFDTNHDQRSHWRWDYPHDFGDQVDCSNPQTASWGKVTATLERVSWYGGDHFGTKRDLPSSWQFKTGDFLAVRPLNWDEIINKADHDENWADPAVQRGGRSRPSNCNNNDEGKGEELTQSSDKGTGK